MNKEYAMEILSGALDSALRAEAVVRGGNLSADAVRAEIRTTNVLLDACIDAGMRHDEPSHMDWAAKRVTRWLCAA